jgi:small basic protein (TIGR04137 family)
MSMDRSLKSADALTRHRNVLTRAERIAKLKDLEQWADGKSAFGLPKVAHRNLKVAKKTKKKEEAAEGAAAAPAAAGTPVKRAEKKAEKK